MPSEFPTDVTAIIGCAVMTGAGAVIHTAGVKRNQSVAIFGAGGVGLCAIAAAAMVDANPIIAVDVDDAKLEFARQFGATHTINATLEDPVSAISKLMDGGVDFAFDTVGAGNTPVQIAQAARPGIGGMREGGMAVLVGLTQEEISVNFWPLLFPGKSYRASFGGSCRPDRDFPVFLDWYRSGRLNLDALVTRRFTLDQINEGVRDLEHGQIFGRSIVVF
jgi:Zn-dependent alcohol dehydrogenase